MFFSRCDVNKIGGDFFSDAYICRLTIAKHDEEWGNFFREYICLLGLVLRDMIKFTN